MAVSLAVKGPKLSGPDIVALETQLRTTLPESYRQFLLSNNVAIPEPNQLTSGPVTTSVVKFFGKSTVDADDLVAQNQIYEGRLPERVIAIALAGGGNLICLSVIDGSVFFWDHEQEAADDDEPSFDNMWKLAQSTAVLLQMLQPFTQEEVVLDPKNVLSVKLRPGFMEKFKKNM